MAGILDWSAYNQSRMPNLLPSSAGILSGIQPPTPPQPTGNFWNTQNPDGTSSYLGGLFNYDPKQDQGSSANGGNRLGLIGSTLQDVAANLSGQPEYSTHIRQQLATQLAQQQKQVRDAALQKFMSAQTPQDKQSALLQFWGSGGDTAGLGTVLKSQQPEFRSVPDGGKLQGFDPYTGLPIGAPIMGNAKPPQTRNIQRGSSNVTQQYNEGNGQWEDVPGAIGPKFKPAAATKAAATGAINIPHPGSMY